MFGLTHTLHGIMENQDWTRGLKDSVDESSIPVLVFQYTTFQGLAV